MFLHLDDAALAMARTAQKDAKSESVKSLAAAVISERSGDIEKLRATYQKQYGQAPPAWPGPQGGQGMHGQGMMAGPGMMMGGAGSMMGAGDAYQMMMTGGRSNWWGAADPDEGFVPALMRVDAMEIAMATLGFSSNDTGTKDLARRVASSRTRELSSLAGMVK
ncbi:DUF305 domain-containing protein [bacterium]|nr:MAG: DUF305 domain-containing protein [bacterium]